MPFPLPSSLHIRTASQPQVIAEKGAELYGITPEKFANWRWQMANQIYSAEQLAKVLQVSENESQAFELLKDKFHAGITPYYALLMDTQNPDCPVRLQATPRVEEASDALGVPDPLNEVVNSPVKEVVHVYPDRVAFCVAQLCPVYCRYCFRKRRDEEVGLHFNPKIVQAGVDYIASQPKIRDVLITGGDPFVAHDGSLEKLLRKLRAIPHVEIIRFGTRVPVTLPYRITEELVDMLAKYHPIWVNTHFNCTEELTPDAARAVDLLTSRGIPVGNQSVFLKGVNNTYPQMKGLLEGLLKLRVRPYYVYHPQIVEGTEHLRVSIEEGLGIMKQLRGNTTGFGIPQYVLDTPYGKTPLDNPRVIGRHGEHVVVETPKGKLWAEPSPLSGNTISSLPELPSLDGVSKLD